MEFLRLVVVAKKPDELTERDCEIIMDNLERWLDDMPYQDLLERKKLN